MFLSSETFSIWDYAVSLQRLLLRSADLSTDENKDENKNIDIIFIGVFYMHIPTIIRGIQIRLATEDEIKSGVSYHEKLFEQEKFFCIISEEAKYFIGALNFSAFFSNLKFDVSSLTDVKFDMKIISES